MADFPVFTDMTEDSALFEIEREDNAVRAPTEGGYEFTRKRFTRPQRKIFNTGFTSLSHDNFLTLDAFYNTHETNLAFYYTVPTSGEIVTVRFAEPIKESHKGVGTVKLWDVRLKLKEV